MIVGVACSLASSELSGLDCMRLAVVLCQAARFPASDACGLRQALHSQGNVHGVSRRFKNRVAAFQVKRRRRSLHPMMG
jgi:hypothetical protein